MRILYIKNAMKGINKLLFVFALCATKCDSLVLGVSKVQKLFPKRNSIIQSDQNFALNNVTVSISPQVTSFVGPSGAGKSTLAKIIIYRELSTSGNIINTTVVQASLLDHLFRQRYDSSKSLSQLIGHTKFSSLFDDCLKSFQIPWHEPVNSLLESKRKTAEIILSIESQYVSSSIPFFLVFDEYFDKDIPTVRDKVYKNVKVLCEHPVLQLQAIVITHSKSTCVQCSDQAVVLHKGKLFDTGPPNKVQLPNQMLWLP